MAAPSNDNLSGALEVALDGNESYTSPVISNAEATSEASEPAGIEHSNLKSLWWKFTPASSGRWIIDSSLSGGDTQMAVYSGPSASATYAGLTYVGGDTDSGSNLAALTRIYLTAGTTYYIQLGSFQGATRNCQIQVAPDLFSVGRAVSVAIPSAGATYTAPQRSNSGATTEPSEPAPIEHSNRRSAWWRYVPAASGSLYVSTAGSGDTQMAVYSGPSAIATPPNWANLTYVAGNTDALAGFSAAVTVSVTAGVPYYIQVGAFNGAVLTYKLTATGPASAAPPPGEVSGSIAASLPALSASLSGGIQFSGAISASLPPLGASLSGTSTIAGVAGTISATLPPLGGSLTGAYSDTATLSAILSPLTANLAGTVLPPPVAGALSATLPTLAANLTGTAYDPGMSGTLNAPLPTLTASLSGDVLGRAGLGLALDSSAVLIVEAALEPEPTVPPGTPSTALHIIAPTVPVPTLVAGRPS